MFNLMLGLGILISYTLGSLLYWRIASIFPPLLYLLLFTVLWRIPESPLWLLRSAGCSLSGQPGL